MRVTINNCQLEVDTDRGVVYVHAPDGFTALRICGVPRPFKAPLKPEWAMDITLNAQNRDYVQRVK